MPEARNLTSDARHSFRLEDHLLDVLYAHLPEQLVGRSAQLLARNRKYAVGGTIPDLLLVVTKRRAVRSVRSKKISLIDCGVLFAVYESLGTTVADLASKLYAREGMIRRSADRLLKARILVDRRDRLAVRKAVVNQTAQVISIEAKLSRWREAVQQAKEYLRFSNAAYVALPEAQVNRISALRSACKAAGVGLIAVSQSTCRVVIRPPKNVPRSGEWFWILNKTRGLGA
jgi:DNA-binding MarR family transcriptional regulator